MPKAARGQSTRHRQARNGSGLLEAIDVVKRARPDVAKRVEPRRAAPKARGLACERSEPHMHCSSCGRFATCMIPYYEWYCGSCNVGWVQGL